MAPPKKAEVVDVPPKPDLLPVTIPEDNSANVPAISDSDRQAALDTFRPEAGVDSGILMPRITIVQALSKVAQRPEGQGRVSVGHIYNTLTQEDLGSEITVIILQDWRQRLMLKVGLGLLCRSDNFPFGPAQMPGGKTIDGRATDDCRICVMKDWPKARAASGEQIAPDLLNKGPECADTYNFLAILVREGQNPDDYEPIVLSFNKTSAGAGKTLNTLKMNTKGKPWELFKYKIRSIADPTGPGGATFYRAEASPIRPDGASTPEEIKSAREWMKILGGKAIDVSGEAEAAEADGATGTPVDVSQVKDF